MTERMRRAMSRQRARNAEASERATERIAEARTRAGDASERARERVDTATQAAAERTELAKQAAGERVGAAKEAAAERTDAAKVAATEVAARVKPKLRGVFHKWAFFVSVIAGGLLVWFSADGEPRLAAGIYALSLSALLGTSAVYHRVNWQRPSSRMWMRRLDHSMIFLLIAGTLTPFALLVMEGPFATAVLIAAWGAAAAGIVVELIWVDAPKWLSVAVYAAVGWVGALGFPTILVEAGIGAGILIAVGGVMYMVGGVIYARQRPDPNPAVFGYHEIFHVLVVAAAAAHFAAIAIYAVPGA